MAKQSQLAEPSMPPRQKSAVSRTTYKQAHALYSGMSALDLRAHELALRHVQRGLAPASGQQLSEEY